MATVIAGHVKLAEKEKELIEMLVGQPINPKTVVELNAWIDLAVQREPNDSPECNLLRAIVAELRIEIGKIPENLWEAEYLAVPAKVINLK